MAMSVKDLCRLCAKKDEFSKDLLDESNRNILKLLQDFIQIIVSIPLGALLPNLGHELITTKLAKQNSRH